MNFLEKIEDIFKKMDRTGAVLVIANLITIFYAIFFGLSFGTIIFSYWLESVIIGFFVIVGMVYYAIAGRKVKESGKILNSVFLVLGAGFFAFHYGFFHFVYLIFLSAIYVFGASGFGLSAVDFSSVLNIGITFFIAHGYSFLVNVAENKKTMNLFNPEKAYSRIIPMHLTIIFGTMIILSGIEFAEHYVLILFMALKTVLDLGAHEKKYEVKKNG